MNGRLVIHNIHSRNFFRTSGIEVSLKFNKVMAKGCPNLGYDNPKSDRRMYIADF